MNIKNIFYSFLPNTTHECWEKDASGLTWSYVDKRREYQVISRRNQVVVKFDVKGKYNAEVTLDGGLAQYIQNLLQKMESAHIPMRPIKPMTPILLTFDSAATKEKKSNEYSKQLESYIGESQKYDAAMIKYEANKKQLEKNRKDLLKVIDQVFDQSINLLRHSNIPC